MKANLQRMIRKKKNYNCNKKLYCNKTSRTLKKIEVKVLNSTKISTEEKVEV